MWTVWSLRSHFQEKQHRNGSYIGQHSKTPEKYRVFSIIKRLLHYSKRESCQSLTHVILGLVFQTKYET